jgi:hypothetical protein
VPARSTCHWSKCRLRVLSGGGGVPLIVDKPDGEDGQGMGDMGKDRRAKTMRFGGDLPRTKHFANVPSSRGAERTEIREKDEAEVELSTTETGVGGRQEVRDRLCRHGGDIPHRKDSLRIPNCRHASWSRPVFGISSRPITTCFCPMAGRPTSGVSAGRLVFLRRSTGRSISQPLPRSGVELGCDRRE